MAKLNVTLTGEGVINNAAVYLEDPKELIPLYLNPVSDTEWSREVSVPIEGPLDYSLIVIAATGTRFKCEIVNMEDGTSLRITGMTGIKNKNYYHESGSRELQ